MERFREWVCEMQGEQQILSSLSRFLNVSRGGYRRYSVSERVKMIGGGHFPIREMPFFMEQLNLPKSGRPQELEKQGGTT